LTTGHPSSLRVALVASARYPLRQPFPGGLEVHTWQLARHLAKRGHQVCVFAGPGSDPALHVHEMPAMPELSALARQDVSMPADYFMAEHFAYLSLMGDLARDDSYDLVHNNSLHYLPIAMAETLPAPMVTTLHTPPTPWLESAMMSRPGQRLRYAAVSRMTAAQWRPMVPDATVIRNGVDLDLWTPGPGGGPPVWSGRIVPEKGLDLAIRAARAAGTGLRIAGPCPHLDYFSSQIRPLLGDGVEYLGHLDHLELAALVGSATVAVVSPRWDEPYGLVVAEAMACGTPVAAFARGALPELVTPASGVLARPDDVDDLAAAMGTAAGLDRAAVRRAAVEHCSIDAMVDGYEALYQQL
jgi:glycosyltransferase involved in cell wall biosynthesis